VGTGLWPDRGGQKLYGNVTGADAGVGEGRREGTQRINAQSENNKHRSIAKLFLRKKAEGENRKLKGKVGRTPAEIPLGNQYGEEGS